MKPAADILLWIAAAFRLWRLGRTRTFASLAYAAAAAGCAVALTVATFEDTIDNSTGPYVSDLLEHALAAISGVAANLFLLALRRQRLSRRAVVARTAVGSLVVAVMIVAFIAAPIHQGYRGDLYIAYGERPTILLYVLVFDIYLGFVLIDNVRLCWRPSMLQGDPGTAASLQLIGLGSAIAVLYPVSRAAYVLTDRLFDSRPSYIRPVGSGAAALGLAVLAIGVLAPQAAGRLVEWITAVRTARRIRPLWRTATARHPELILPTRWPITARRAALRCDRMLIETCEALHLDGIDLDATKDPAALAHAVIDGTPTRSKLTPGQPSTPRDRNDERTVLLAIAGAYAQRHGADRARQSVGAE